MTKDYNYIIINIIFIINISLLMYETVVAFDFGKTYVYHHTVKYLTTYKTIKIEK